MLFAFVLRLAKWLLVLTLHMLGAISAFVVSVLVLDRGNAGLIGEVAVFAVAFLLLPIRTSRRSLPASDI